MNKNAPDTASFEELKWRQEMARQDFQRAEDKLSERKLKVSEAAIQSGQVAIRTAALINGGAAVAVLAFLGGLIGQGRIELNQINIVAGSLIWFVFGVAAAVCSLGSAYIVNYSRRWELECLRLNAEPPFIATTPASKKWARATTLFQLIALVVGVMSLVLFVVGMWDLKTSIGSLKPRALP